MELAGEAESVRQFVFPCDGLARYSAGIGRRFPTNLGAIMGPRSSVFWGLGLLLVPASMALADEIPRVPILVPPTGSSAPLTLPNLTPPTIPTVAPAVVPLPTPPATIPDRPTKSRPAQTTSPTETNPVQPAAATVVSRVVPSRSVESISADAFPQAIADAKAAHARLRDYSGHYIRRERVAGKVIPEQTCELRVRLAPFAISVKVIAPQDYAGRETVYSTKSATGKAYLREAGKVSYLPVRHDDPRLQADTSHALNDVGLAAVLNRVEQAMALERRLNNPVQVVGSAYQFDGKPCTRWEIFMDRPHAQRYAARHVLYLDKQTSLPVRYEAYDAPRSGSTSSVEPFEVQSFVGLKLNTGLGESVFDR